MTVCVCVCCLLSVPSSDLSHLCCLARRRPKPCHRWLYSSPHTWTQSTKRFNILPVSLCWRAHTIWIVEKKTDLLCVTWLHFVFLNWLLFTMSPAVFDTYVGCSTLGEDWVDPEHDAQICTLLAAPQVDFHLPPHKVQVILPVTEKQWTLSQVRWVVITHKTPVVQDSPPHIHTQTNI